MSQAMTTPLLDSWAGLQLVLELESSFFPPEMLVVEGAHSLEERSETSLRTKPEARVIVV